MEIVDVKFVGSFPSESQCPPPTVPEFAFIGRSNVGKSSLINMLCGRKEIAKVSKTPGKTQLLNFFLVDESWYLVDLPGYGYAKISKAQRKKWELMIERYLMMRKSLQCAFVLIDSRHELQKIDEEFISWLGDRRIPFVIVYTKIDKLKKQSQTKRNIKKIEDALLKTWNELPQQFLTSSVSRIGKKEILQFIFELNQTLEHKD